MKIEMKKTGELRIDPESPIECYVLQKWAEENLNLDTKEYRSKNLVINLLEEQ